MCMSRLHRVVAAEGHDAVLVEDVNGRIGRASLLALDGPPPRPGEWLVVNSGYAVDRVDEAEARSAVVEIQRAIEESGGAPS
jgi:hydrogenase maturation factor